MTKLDILFRYLSTHRNHNLGDKINILFDTLIKDIITETEHTRNVGEGEVEDVDEKKLKFVIDYYLAFRNELLHEVGYHQNNAEGMSDAVFPSKENIPKWDHEEPIFERKDGDV